MAYCVDWCFSVYEKLGDVRELLMGRTETAMLLLQIDAAKHQQKIAQLFTWSLLAAMRMQLPEAEQITKIMEQALVRSQLENFNLQLSDDETTAGS